MNIQELIEKAIREEIGRITDEEIVGCQKIIERRVRERTGEICARVVQKMNMQMYGRDQLCITVDFQNTKT